MEEPLDVAGALRREAGPNSAILVDCLTLWLSNLIAAGRDTEAETSRLVAALADPGGPVVLVSNEVGLGLVPDHALSRRFRDDSGRVHQAVAAAADRVVFMVAGLPQIVK